MTIKPGAIRFNTDSMKLEIFRGSANYEGSASMAGIGTLAAGQWEEIVATSPEVQTGGTRGFAFGCIAGNGYNNYYYNISSTGDAIDFGDFASNRYFCSATSDRTRAVVDSGEGTMSSKEFFTMASGGGGTNFGNVSYDSSNGHRAASAVSNGTRAVFAGGDDFVTYRFNNIEYVTIQSTGNAVDFGDLYTGTRIMAEGNSSTRGIYAGGDGDGSPSSHIDVIQFITTSTLGNSADFGNLAQGDQSALTGASNATRMIIAGGAAPNNNRSDTIEYLTIATLGDSIDFGNLTDGRQLASSSASSTRVCIAGGEYGSPATRVNIIDYVQIASTGDAKDFGDLLENTYVIGGTSNGHGGL